MYGKTKKLHLIAEILRIENDAVLDEVEKALLIPNEIKNAKRKVGILEGKATYAFVGGHNTKEEEFFGQ